MLRHYAYCLVVIPPIIVTSFVTQPTSALEPNGEKITCIENDYYHHCTQSYFGQQDFRNMPFGSPLHSEPREYALSITLWTTVSK
jgi:hypothetical protein